MKVLLTSTSFQDTPGSHKIKLMETGYKIDYMRGPIAERELLPIIQDYDGVICGDDHFSKNVIKAGSKGRLKVLSKYGIGLDKIDLEAAKEFGIIVTNCPGVNHVTVAEHIIALILMFYKNLFDEISTTRSGKWNRLIGQELFGKKIGVIGLGRIGKEVLIRSKAFGLELFAFDKKIDKKFVSDNEVIVTKSIKEIFNKVDIISLSMDLNKENKHLINRNFIENNINSKVLLVNSARGELVDETAVLEAVQNDVLEGYLTDVLDVEPMYDDHPFIVEKKIFVTPHIASRTYQSVERQANMAIDNLVQSLNIIGNE